MDPIVSTKYGKVKGLLRTSKLGDVYTAFYGIPYAKPPLGNLRFKAPVPVEAWQGIFHATTEPPAPCYLVSHFRQEYSEDCLYLNVYTKNIHVKRPVIVYIYGGDFNSGSNSTKILGPDFLMQRDVVVVTFNYRLNAQGLLIFKNPTLDVPGNAGLKDQRLALTWIKENIDAFGGDAENVTLIGHSAGGCSVHHHLISPGSKGLFHRAIVMAGAALCSWGVCASEAMGEKVALNTGWNGVSDERGALEHLKALTPDALTEASRHKYLITREHILKDEFHPFGPKIESYESVESFLTEEPLNLMRNCWGNDIDVIFWFASNELLFKFDNYIQPQVGQPLVEAAMIPYKIRQTMSEDKIQAGIKSLKSLYGNFNDFNHKNYQQMLNFRNDQIIVHGIHRSILSRVNYAKGSTRLVYFDLVSDSFNHVKIRHKALDQKGAAHGDELSYIFSNEYGTLPGRDSVEFQNIQKVVDLLVGYATEGRQHCENISWKPIEKIDLPYNYEALKIQDPDWSIGKVDEISRLRAWDSLYSDGELY